MPRCHLCDYSNETPQSPYNETIQQPHTKQKISLDPLTNTYVCSACEGVYEQNLLDLETL